MEKEILVTEMKLIKSNDGDKDGIIDFSDNCPKIANSDQSDSDSDGIRKSLW